jgi:hypothetical protein
MDRVILSVDDTAFALRKLRRSLELHPDEGLAAVQRAMERPSL